MGLPEKINANPTVYAVDTHVPKKYEVYDAIDEDSADPFEPDEVFEMLRHVNDPEHPLTLEQLKVMSLENILVDDANSYVRVYFTPTIPHCSSSPNALVALCAAFVELFTAKLSLQFPLSLRIGSVSLEKVF
ncbi:hypothetical protein P43SY_008922 [Pythium insidiosum]|uniref:MIP18 family-like domain-containing protein n=1 Tax=Pythium insidiosum TaxID=114742 RepID=A0AAD5M9I9_PYTIN|nr:hypothetical protein P43SY_008922 [Pythium insidiosum]KAJ0409160.1 hypothetical protein ATCC90586_004693 [Pythium insidiosum]